jgi:serine phosphatase RsbU (regulator of sigma subunit)
MRWLWTLLFLAQPAFAIIERAEIHLADRKPADLRGFWDFRARSVSGDYGPWRQLRIDKEWRLQGVEKSATVEYRLKLRIPSKLRSGDFALMLPPVSAAVKIFLNGKLVEAKGKVDAGLLYPQNSSEAFAWYPVKNDILAAAEEQILTLEITGFQGGGGVFGNTHIYFGGVDEVREKFNFLFLATAFLAAAIFMIAVFHFALVPDRNYRRANLHYVLLSLSMSFHILGMNGVGYYLFDSFLFNAALIHIILAVFPFTLIGFSLRYFRLKFPVTRAASYVFAAVMSVILLACALNPKLIPYYLDFGLPAGFVAMAMALFFALYAAVRGVMKKIEGSKLVLAGFIVYSVTVLNDMISYFSYSIPVTLADVGFLFAVICIAVALAGRLQRAAVEKDELREWQKEISLAAQIQNLALPKRSLRTKHLSIETLFKPMKIIGGDFFAFHEISDTSTGIFIADVSGHGIAAALLVSTIKSIFLQQRDCAHDPALLMHNMNNALYPHLQEQFITAAYCIIDFETGKIRVAQAGHPPVYFLHTETHALERVKPKGRFFGFDANLQYETAELDLSRYSRIFLYSDGVIEAGSLHGSPYTVTRLESFLIETAAHSGDRLLAELERDIQLKARTQMNTDDDSSCVVVDLRAA